MLKEYLLIISQGKDDLFRILKIYPSSVSNQGALSSELGKSSEAKLQTLILKY